MRKFSGFATAALLVVSAVSIAQDKEKSAKVYTLGVSGSVCQACSGKLAEALKSVEGCKVIQGPAKGDGDQAMTMVIVELSGKATLGKVCTALEDAKTPHAEKVAPGVIGAVPLKLKAGTTGEQFVEALRKAGLLDE